MRILVIDDEFRMRIAIRRMLRRAGYEVLEAPDGEAGIDIYKQQRADLVITDLLMPRKDGLETILELRQENPDVKIIAISGNGSNRLEKARALGAVRTISKPFFAKDILKAVKDVMER